VITDQYIKTLAYDAGKSANLHSKADAYSDTLNTQGFASFSSVFSPEEVVELRAALSAGFAVPGESRYLSPQLGSVHVDLFTWPEVAKRTFVPKLFNAIRTVLGEHIVILPEHGAHREGFGSWHKDTDMFERAKQLDHWCVNYHVYQCAVYMQDNSLATGGGLSVIPGSHRVPHPHTVIDPVLRKQCQDWYDEKREVALGLKAGDLLIFDTRLNHSATPRTVVAEHEKLAIFLIAAHVNEFSELYTHFIHARPDYAYLKDYAVPEQFQVLARAHGCRFSL
jgi:hypothetical protein